jgi:hypothetical protein
MNADVPLSRVRRALTTNKGQQTSVNFSSFYPSRSRRS